MHRELLDASGAGKAFSLGDEKDLVDSLREVYNNKQIYGSAARKFALKNDWSVACKKISEIYDQIIGHS
jgi:hypothetical protein